MNVIQERLINAYIVLFSAEEIGLNEIPEYKVIGGKELPIRSEVIKRLN